VADAQAHDLAGGQVLAQPLRDGLGEARRVGLVVQPLGLRVRAQEQRLQEDGRAGVRIE
jgi:hypothetical protein